MQVNVGNNVPLYGSSSSTSGSSCWAAAPATSPALLGSPAGTSPPAPGVGLPRRPGGRPRSRGGVAAEIDR